MCGLVAIVTKNHHGFVKDQVDAFDNLLYIDALRGMDSTGVFVVDKDGSMELAKEATASYDFRQAVEYQDLCKSAFRTGRAMVGHNRAATKGSVVDTNAHPFVVDDRITLCHNGTLWGDWSKLADAKVEVDSHAIAHKIHECDDDVEKALQQVSGAYALIWHDFKHNTLNFVRNSQRPLNYVETANGWIWASEANMIEWILARYKFKKESEITELGAGILVTYDFSNSSWKLDHKEIKLEAPKPVYQNPVWNGAHVRNPHAVAYNDADDEDGGWNSFGRPACEPLHMAEMQKRVQDYNEQGTRLARARLTGRTIANENSLAVTHKLDIPVITFSTQSEELAEDDTWVLATCIDWDTVKPNDGSMGYFLYALLNKDTNYMVKVFLPSTTDETDLLDWSLNGVEADFHVMSRQWRGYTDAGNGQGYAMLNCDKMRAPMSALEKKLEALV